MSGRALGGGAAAAILARITARRLFRTKSFWLSVVLAGLPVLALLGLVSDWSPDRRWGRVFTLLSPMLCVLMPLNLASVIAEEGEDETYSFLWSRPVPRWSITVGKMVAMLPFATALAVAAVVGAWVICFGGAGDTEPLARGVVAAVAGCAAAGALSVALGTLIRKQAVAVSTGYLLMIDFPMGKIPLSISNMSITHHFNELATGDAVFVPLAWLAAATALWTALALWRVSAIELTKK